MNASSSSPQDRRTFLKTAGAVGAGLWLAGAAAPDALAEDAPPPSSSPITGAGESVPRRKFGRHDFEVSSLALGGHALATASSQEESNRIARAALDRGINFFDNAWEYHDGRGEECMGQAIKGIRDKIFLMTKVCTHGQGKDVAMRMLEESLTRLGTDHLDLWQIHALARESEIDSAFAPGGVIEALELAQKQGKVRFVGFTGHLDPRVHAKMLSHKYPFDSVQCPLGVFDGANAEGFQKLVLPELVKQGIAPLAMKTLSGGGQPVRDKIVTADEAIRYALSLPIALAVSGIHTMDQLTANANTAARFKPFKKEEMVALEQRVSPQRSQYEPYRSWAYQDGDAHRNGRTYAV